MSELDRTNVSIILSRIQQEGTPLSPNGIVVRGIFKESLPYVVILCCQQV